MGNAETVHDFGGYDFSYWEGINLKKRANSQRFNAPPKNIDTISRIYTSVPGTAKFTYRLGARTRGKEQIPMTLQSEMIPGIRHCGEPSDKSKADQPGKMKPAGVGLKPSSGSTTGFILIMMLASALTIVALGSKRIGSQK